MTRLGLRARLVLSAFLGAVTLTSALGGLVVLPVNDLSAGQARDAARREAALAAIAIEHGAPTPAGVSIGVRAPGPGEAGVRLADGRVVRVAVVSDGVIERQERIGLAKTLVVVLTSCLGLALFAAGGHVRRLGRVAAVARRIAASELDVRTGVRGRDEVARLAADVDAMAARLAELGRARRDFVGMVSHDLRTPLTAIRGQTYTLARRLDDEESARRLTMIDAEAVRMAGLVDDLLTLSEADAGRLSVDLVPLDALEVLTEVGDHLHAVAGTRAIDLSVSCDARLVIAADRRRLAQAMINLGANALRHAPAGSEVQVVGRATGGLVELSVTDAGPGIDERDVPRLLQAFERGARGGSGVGLGLAIVSEIVRLHRGQLQLTRAPGGGTIARVVLPQVGCR